jgi:putative phosphoesterase
VGNSIQLGLIADTHIPDRVEALHPDILPIFREAGVSAILHAGDVSVPQVLNQLETVAPVYAVRGNRDIYQLRHLPMSRLLHFGDVPVGLIHGQGNLGFYLYEKVRIFTVGYRLEFYLPYLFKSLPRARVIIFGHSHMPMVRWVNGKLIINPGSASCPNKEYLASIGLLQIREDKIEGELVWLK